MSSDKIMIVPEWLRHAVIVVDNASSPTYSFSESINNEMPALRRIAKITRMNITRMSSKNSQRTPSETVFFKDQTPIQHEMKHPVSSSIIQLSSGRGKCNVHGNGIQFQDLTANYSFPCINHTLLGMIVSSSSVILLPTEMYLAKASNSSYNITNKPKLYDSCPQKPIRRRSLDLKHC